MSGNFIFTHTFIPYLIGCFMKKAVTELATFIYEDDVVFVYPSTGIYLDREGMENMLKTAIELTQGKKYYAIVDLSDNVDSTPEARSYYANSDLNRFRYADAFIVASLTSRVLLNFFSKFHKPQVPFKSFNNKEGALLWVRELKRKKIKSY